MAKNPNYIELCDCRGACNWFGWTRLGKSTIRLPSLECCILSGGAKYAWASMRCVYSMFYEEEETCSMESWMARWIYCFVLYFFFLTFSLVESETNAGYNTPYRSISYITHTHTHTCDVQFDYQCGSVFCIFLASMGYFFFVCGWFDHFVLSRFQRRNQRIGSEANLPFCSCCRYVRM